jgi:hypothetical protein
MMLRNKKLLLLCCLLGTSSIAFGYNFTIKNATKKSLHVYVQVEDKPFDPMHMEPIVRNMVINPNKKHVFSFGGDNCLEGIWVGEQQIPIRVKTEEGYAIPESPLCQNVTGIIVVGADNNLIALFEK